MRPSELIGLLGGTFRENFADDLAARILAADAEAALYAAATSGHPDLSAPVRHKVLFRSAYVLERIYFTVPERFRPFEAGFLERDFIACTDASARRHFAKIMADLLERRLAEPHGRPALQTLERIAEAAAEWTSAPTTKVAVRVWTVEILRICRPQVGWVAEMWDDLLEMLVHDATPGIAARLRRDWRKA